MLNWFVKRQIDGLERSLGASMNYLRYMYRHAPGAFFSLRHLQPFMKRSSRPSPEVIAIAGLGATVAEDCGECVEIGRKIAMERAGLKADTVDRLIEGRHDGVSEELVLVYRFGQTIASGADSVDLRDAVIARFGEEGLCEIALTIAIARIPPALKRGLGFATTCTRTRRAAST